MSRVYNTGLLFGKWLKHHELWSERAHDKTLDGLKRVGSYLWLVAGLLLIWVGLMGMYVIYSTGAPSWPSAGVFVGVFCLYKFGKIRTRAQ